MLFLYCVQPRVSNLFLVAAVPGRPCNAVYTHVRRIYHPMRKQGPWGPDEDEKLIQCVFELIFYLLQYSLISSAVNELGQKWETISFYVGRPPSDCRDRYRDYLKYRDHRATGEYHRNASTSAAPNIGL